MRAGTLDRVIVIQRKTTEQDAIGHPVETWSTLATVSASFRGLSGSESIRAGRAVAAETGIFTIRYLTGVTVQDRISYGGKSWDIENLREIGRREALEITAGAAQ